VTDVETGAAQRKSLRIVLPGLMLAMLLAMLDNMIIGTAMPRIVGELGGLAHLSWVVTAYILATTVSTPIWGKLGDLYGRKSLFITSIVIFLVGSALSGAAQDMGQLIGFRALQGLGAGGLMVGAFAIIGDLVPPRERGRYQGLMGGIMALAMIAGPLVGGFITDHLSWRWAFYVNLPLGGLALLVIVATLHLPKYRTEHRIDWVGAALLSVGITSLVLITTWGGTEYPWLSGQIIGLAALAVVSIGVFLYVEQRVPEPILPLKLFTNRNFALVSGIGFLVGFSLFGAVSFLPLYQQTVQGASATNSGLLLLPMMAGVLIVSIVIGRVITKTGKYRAFPLVGGIVLVSGMFLLSLLDRDTTKTMSALYMIVLGAGMGFLMQTTLLIAQNSVEQRDLGVASSTATFVRSIGGSFGVSLFGAIFTSRLREDVAKIGPEAAARLDGSGGQLDPSTLVQLPAPIREGFLNGIAHAMSSVFSWAIVLAVIVPVLAWFIQHVPLRGYDSAPAADADEAALAEAEAGVPVARS